MTITGAKTKDPILRTLEKPEEDILQEYEVPYADRLGNIMEEFTKFSHDLGRIQRQIATKKAIANLRIKGERKPYMDQIDALAKSASTTREHMAELAKAALEMLAENSVPARIARAQVNVWKLFDHSLRHILANKLLARKIDVTDIVSRADALEDEENQRRLKGLDVEAGEDDDKEDSSED